MSFIEANGAPVQSGTVTFRTPGNWEAVLVVDADAALPTDGARVTIAAPGMTLAGSAVRPGTDLGGSSSLRVVGGAGKLLDALAPSSLTTTTVRGVIVGILTAAGETLSATVDPALLARDVSRWVRPASDATTALTTFATSLGCTWRVLDDGTVWMGVDALTTLEVEHDVTAENPAEGTLEVATEVLSIRPGQTFRDGPVSEVVYVISDKVRATILRNAGGNRASKAIRAIAEKATAGTKLHPPTAATVVGQNADGTLELKVDSPDMPSISKVPIRHGLPGVTRLELETGARVCLSFEGGNPQRPFASLFAGGRTTFVVWDGDHFEFGGTEAVAMSANTNARLTAIEAYLATPGPVIGPAPLVPLPIESTTLFADGS